LVFSRRVLANANYFPSNTKDNDIFDRLVLGTLPYIYLSKEVFPNPFLLIPHSAFRNIFVRFTSYNIFNEGG